MDKDNEIKWDGFDPIETKPIDENDVVRVLGKGVVFYYIKEYGRWFRGSSVPQMLRKIGITSQDWYNKNILKVGTTPLCPICNKNPRIYVNLHVGYRETCSEECGIIQSAKSRSSTYSNHPEIFKGRRSCKGIKKSRKDPKIKELEKKLKPIIRALKRVEKGISRINKDIEKILTFDLRKKIRSLNLSNAAKKSYQDNPERRETQRSNMISRYNNPEYYQKFVDTKRKSWEHPTESMLRSGGKRSLPSYEWSKWENRLIRLDSSWEWILFKSLSGLNEIYSIKRTPYPIRYYKSIEERYASYLFDFLVNDNILIEVKSNNEVEDQTNLDKFSAAKEYCSKNGLRFIVITENFLFKGLDPYIGNFEFLSEDSLNKLRILISEYSNRWKIITKAVKDISRIVCDLFTLLGSIPSDKLGMK